jgi:hypothetical protein
MRRIPSCMVRRGLIQVFAVLRSGCSDQVETKAADLDVIDLYEHQIATISFPSIKEALRRRTRLFGNGDFENMVAVRIEPVTESGKGQAWISEAHFET